MTFAGGSTHLDQNISVNGGSGTVTNAGVLQLTNSHTIAGGFMQTSVGVLDIGISGTGTGTGLYGHLTASGAATFGGGLAAELLGGFSLAAGEVFDWDWD